MLRHDGHGVDRSRVAAEHAPLAAGGGVPDAQRFIRRPRCQPRATRAERHGVGPARVAAQLLPEPGCRRVVEAHHVVLEGDSKRVAVGRVRHGLDGRVGAVNGRLLRLGRRLASRVNREHARPSVPGARGEARAAGMERERHDRLHAILGLPEEGVPLEVPEVQPAFHARAALEGPRGGSQQRAVGAPGHGAHAVAELLVRADFARLARAGDGPHPHGAVGTHRRQVRAAGPERGRPGGGGVAGEGRDGRAGLRVPQLHRLVGGGAGEQAAVGARGQAGDRRVVRLAGGRALVGQAVQVAPLPAAVRGGRLGQPPLRVGGFVQAQRAAGGGDGRAVEHPVRRGLRRAERGEGEQGDGSQRGRGAAGPRGDGHVVTPVPAL